MSCCLRSDLRRLIIIIPLSCQTLVVRIAVGPASGPGIIGEYYRAGEGGDESRPNYVVVKLVSLGLLATSKQETSEMTHSRT
jgi:hypothetical protein